MEFDILNEIITASVGELFKSSTMMTIQESQSPSLRNKLSKQPGSMSTSLKMEKKKKHEDDFDDLNDRDDIPNMYKSIDSGNPVQKSTEISGMRSKNVDNSFDKKSTPSSNSLSISGTTINKQKELDSKSQVNASQSYSISSFENEPMKKEPYTVETWIKKDGPSKLHESLRKLNLDIQTLGKINLSTFSPEQLNTEKKGVKNELKNYDNSFAAYFKRLPNREEKEPMRPLYIYYKKLKQYMTKVIEKGGARPSSANSTTVTSANTSGISANSDKSKENPKSTTLNYIGNENKGSKISEKKIDSSFEYNLSRENSKERMQPTAQQNYSKQNPGKGVSSNNLEQLRKQLEDLKSIRSQLREKLHAYQVDFTRNNNRKIKYHKDIAPVEGEYKKYKDIKQEILRLEGILGL